MTGTAECDGEVTIHVGGFTCKVQIKAGDTPAAIEAKIEAATGGYAYFYAQALGYCPTEMVYDPGIFGRPSYRYVSPDSMAEIITEARRHTACIVDGAVRRGLR